MNTIFISLNKLKSSNLKWAILGVFLLGFNYSWAQIEEGNAKVERAKNDIKEASTDVQRVYEPKVEAVEKIKQTPRVTPPESEKIPVDYSLVDVEAESDFETSTIGAEQLPVEDDELYKNYVKAGYGNRGALNVDAFVDHELSDDKHVGGKFSFQSTEGDIDNVAYDTGESKASIEGFYNLDFPTSQLDLGAGYQFNKVSYYGVSPLYESSVDTNADVGQTYHTIWVGGEYNALDNPYFNKANVKAKYFTDTFSAKEMLLDANGQFGYKNLTNFTLVENFSVDAVADVNLSYSNTDFSEIEDAKYSYITLGAKPGFLATGDRIKAKIGANVQWINESESSQSNFYVFPDISVYYQYVPVFGFYGGFTGGVDWNLYQNMVDDNAYLLPYQIINPTINNWEIFAGIRGDIGDKFKYDGKASYTDISALPLFVKTNHFTSGSDNAYAHANTFQAFYDNATKMGVTGSIQYVAVEDLSLGATVKFNNYDLDEQDEAWGLPTLQGEINARYKFWNDKLILGSDVFLIGKRNGAYYNRVNDLIQTNLDSYIDLNLNATYLINSRWAAFLNGNNLLNDNYNRFVDYPVQGIQVLGGVMFKF